LLNYKRPDKALNDSQIAGAKISISGILRKYGYPPDKQEKATLTVLEQAELLWGDITI
jgi:type I restriction enzyme R subunit